MTKMTVLYAVFVALMFAGRRTPAHPRRGGVRPGRAARRHRHRPRRAARRGRASRAPSLAVGSACWPRSSTSPAACRSAGRCVRRILGRHRPGRDRVHRAWPASCRRARAPAPASPARRIGVLFVLRAVGDVGARWLSWLSPFGWNTQLRAWTRPPLVGAAAVRRRSRSPSSRPPRCSARAATSAPGCSPPGPGPRRLAAAGRRDRAEPAAAHPDAGRLDGRRGRARHGARRDRAQHRRPARLPSARDMMERLGGVGAARGHPDRRGALDLGGRGHLLRHRRRRARWSATSTTAAPSRCWPRPPRAPQLVAPRCWSRWSGRPGCCWSPGVARSASGRRAGDFGGLVGAAARPGSRGVAGGRARGAPVRAPEHAGRSLGWGVLVLFLRPRPARRAAPSCRGG